MPSNLSRLSHLWTTPEAALDPVVDSDTGLRIVRGDRACGWSGKSCLLGTQGCPAAVVGEIVVPSLRTSGDVPLLALGVDNGGGTAGTTAAEESKG